MVSLSIGCFVHLYNVKTVFECCWLLSSGFPVAVNLPFRCCWKYGCWNMPCWGCLCVKLGSDLLLQYLFIVPPMYHLTFSWSLRPNFRILIFFLCSVFSVSSFLPLYPCLLLAFWTFWNDRGRQTQRESIFFTVQIGILCTGCFSEMFQYNSKCFYQSWCFLLSVIPMFLKVFILVKMGSLRSFCSPCAPCHKEKTMCIFDCDVYCWWALTFLKHFFSIFFLFFIHLFILDCVFNVSYSIDPK